MAKFVSTKTSPEKQTFVHEETEIKWIQRKPATIRSRIVCLPVTLSENSKIKIYRNKILSVVLYGCKTWSLILREELWLRVFENRVLRRYLGLRGTRWQGSSENYVIWSFSNSASLLLTRYCYKGEWDGRGLRNTLEEEKCLQGLSAGTGGKGTTWQI